jgi:hypothetical protein
MEDLLTLGKVVLVFGAVVAAMKKRLMPLGLALAAGGAAIGLLMGKSPAWLAREVAGGLDSILFSRQTGDFVAVLGMIVALSYVLERAGQIERLTSSFRACVRNPRVTLATLPALIGLLPMPGGALFSAPMVEASAAGTGLDAEDKALVNYWYRHVWEYAWPLYPGVLFTAQLLGYEARTVAAAQAPLCLAALLAGGLFLRRAALPPDPRERAPRGRALRDAFVALLPLLVIFGLHLGARQGLVLSVAAGLALAAAWHRAAGNLGTGPLVRSVFVNAGVLDMMVLAYGAKIFGEVMERSGAIAGIAHLFQSLELPLLLLVVALPFSVGFFGGMTIVFVMTTFPVLLAYPEVAADRTAYISLAFAAGFSGTLLSPIHSCLVLSTRYFRSDLLGTIRRMVVPCLLVLATGAALLVLYKHLRSA